jgi:hypothetical protein
VIRIAFLGSDSTHADAFAKLINIEGGNFMDRARVVSIWGTNVKETRDKALALNIPRVAKDPEDALKGVDLAMVIGRFGDSHMVPASIALRKGIPTFIDKPFTAGMEDAMVIVDQAKRHGTRFFSASPLRFANEVIACKQAVGRSPDFKELFVACPQNCIELGNDVRFESIFFYGAHVLEIVLEVMGFEVQSFEFVKKKSQTTVFLGYEKNHAVIHLVRDINEFYSMTAYSTSKAIKTDIRLDGTYYTNLLEFILHDFIEKGEVVPVESSLKAVAILSEIDKG